MQVDVQFRQYVNNKNNIPSIIPQEESEEGGAYASLSLPWEGKG